jgi:post-segregation antitoxin (ccd killing protein)
MQMPVFEARARKRTVSLTIDSDLYAKVWAARINASRAAEEAQALRDKQTEVLCQEIRQDREALAKYVAEHGDPAAELPEMFEQSPMQDDVFANPAPHTRRAELAGEGRGRIVTSLAPRGALANAAGRLLPIAWHGDREYLLAIELMTSIPVTKLRQPLGSIAARRDDITRALDWLFTGG